MKILFKAFAKQLFGANDKKLPQTLFIYFIVFWGLYIADIKIAIAPSILYLMISTFTAGVMWQALSSKDIAGQNIVMLPFDNKTFVFSYVTSLGAYTILTKTVALFSVLMAVSNWGITEILGSILCTIHATLITAVVYSIKKYWYIGSLWAVAVTATTLFCGNQLWFIPALILHGIFIVILLQGTDGYLFYVQEEKNHYIEKKHRQYSVLRYLFRYLIYHKNYMINTVIMWCVACVLPLFFKQMEGLSVIPIGFAILSLNTPIGILLSCDLALEQMIHSLPGQKKAFCVPYCLFLFLCNIIADMIFLCSLQIQHGGVTVPILATAIFFALQSAIGSVLLEWFFPIRNWKIASDLWHHPRKYIVSVAMMLLAGVVGALPGLIPILMLILAVEVFILLFPCWKCIE